jgi:hypothetical protein
VAWVQFPPQETRGVGAIPTKAPATTRREGEMQPFLLEAWCRGVQETSVMGAIPISRGHVAGVQFPPIWGVDSPERGQGRKE